MNTTVIFEESSIFEHYLPQWLGQCVFAISGLFSDSIDNLKIATSSMSQFLCVYACISAALYIYHVKYSKYNRQIQAEKRVLLVIAHPVDICLYFGPTVLKLKNIYEIYLLCLTGGNYTDEDIRKKELYQSCEILGIPQSNIMILNHTRMPLDRFILWNARRTARLLLNHIESLSIDEVYTFDIVGVDAHGNHTSIYYAFARLCLTEQLPPGVKVFLLESVNRIRRHSMFIDSALSSISFSKRVFVVSVGENAIIRSAIQRFYTRVGWSRTIQFFTSRYMYINTYKELEKEDVQLDLQMSDSNFDPLL